MRDRPRSSVQFRLTLSYAGFLTLAGVRLLAAVALFLLRYIPDGDLTLRRPDGTTRFVPDRTDLLAAFTPVAALVVGSLLIFGVVGGWFLAGRMVRPLNRMADAAHQVSLGALSHRIHLGGPQDEFRELADVFDSMLETVEEHAAEQRRFAANASHELRTPLAVVQTLLDDAAADPDRDVETLITRLQEVNVRAAALTEALLLLSRSDQRAFDRDSVDLSLVTEDAAETLSPLASTYGIRLDLTSQPAEVDGSTALLRQLASNLIHNAIVHNTAEHGHVWIRV